MKYRTDFVTNSSSSSFIVSINNTADISAKARKYLQFLTNTSDDEFTFDKFISIFFEAMCPWIVDDIEGRKDYIFLKNNGFSETQAKTIILMDNGFYLSDILNYDVIKEKISACAPGESIYHIPMTDQDELCIAEVYELIYSDNVEILSSESS